MIYVFAAVAALVLDIVALFSIYAVGRFVEKRRQEQLTRKAFTTIHHALANLTISEIDAALKHAAKTKSDRILALLAVVQRKRDKAKADEAARQAEFSESR